MNRSTDRRATFVIFCLVVLLSVFGSGLGAAVRRSKPLVVKPVVVGSEIYQIACQRQGQNGSKKGRWNHQAVKVGDFEANGEVEATKTSSVRRDR